MGGRRRWQNSYAMEVFLGTKSGAQKGFSLSWYALTLPVQLFMVIRRCISLIQVPAGSPRHRAHIWWHSPGLLERNLNTR